MKRYNLLTQDDLIPNNHYEVVSLFGRNPNPRSEIAFYDKYGQWCGIEESHTILEIIDNSVMLILAKERPERYKEIVLGGSYDDGKYNDERSKSSYMDCEELYPIKIAYYLDMSDRNDYAHCKCSNCGMTFDNYLAVKLGQDSCDYIGVRDDHKYCSKCGYEMRVKRKKFREIK